MRNRKIARMHMRNRKIARMYMRNRKIARMHMRNRKIARMHMRNRKIARMHMRNRKIARMYCVWKYSLEGINIGRRVYIGSYVLTPRDLTMSHLMIDNAAALAEFLRKIADAPVIAYDTEFISEGRYQSQLCLIQLAADGVLALIDPMAVDNLEPFWNLLCDGRREIVVHACRSELEFCFRGIGRMPPKLFDVQLAAGFIGIDYPAGFRTLLEKILKRELPKAETRTEWNKRPLTSRQIDYALDDVRHLEAMSQKLKSRLESVDRLDWYYEEADELKARLRDDFETPRWRSVPKSSHLKPRKLAILRELWFWRDRLAKKHNQPANRIFRDDLLVELARRSTADPNRIASVRGLQRSDLPRILPDIVAAVNKALNMPVDELPSPAEWLSYPQYTVMSQFLYSALSSICKHRRIAQQLVGGPGDIRELIAAELETLPEGIQPRLRHGWRTAFVGNLLDDLLNGRTAIRLDRNNPDEPLSFF